jgi:hypothetical protein
MNSDEEYSAAFAATIAAAAYAIAAREEKLEAAFSHRSANCCASCPATDEER